MGERTVGERSRTDDGFEGDVPLRSRSFAELVATLQKLNALESAIASAIARARVPVQEVRRLLRAQDTLQAENAPAFQFMREVFAQVGLPLQVDSVSRFALTFTVPESPYVRLFAHDAPRKTCAFVSEALSRFLSTDLGLEARVEEVACRSAGDPSCRFDASFDPHSVRTRVLDRHDWDLLEGLAGGEAPRPAGAALGMTEEETDFRMERLIGYGVVAADGRVRDEGEAMRRRGTPLFSEAFAPPWRETSQLTESIAHATSFAEAAAEVTEAEPSEEGEAREEVVAMAAECRSFAELLARATKGRSWE